LPSVHHSYLTVVLYAGEQSRIEAEDCVNGKHTLDVEIPVLQLHSSFCLLPSISHFVNKFHCLNIVDTKVTKLPYICTFIPLCCGSGSSVGIATGYGLDGLEIESRWGARFSAPVQTGPGAHPASCTMGTGSFPGVKSGRGMTLTPHPLLVPWSRKDRAIPPLPLWTARPVQSLSTCTRVHFTFCT
jgi:hypothetical protein